MNTDMGTFPVMSLMKDCVVSLLAIISLQQQQKNELGAECTMTKVTENSLF